MRKLQFLFNILTILLIGAVAVTFLKTRKLTKKLKHSTFVSPTPAFVSSESYTIWNSLSAKYPVSTEKPFVIVIASYNNASVCEKNLFSVFSQHYNNYRVIYIDDCSKDGTYDRVQNFIKMYKQEDRVTLIHNETRQLKLANLYKAYHSCKDEEIIVCLDGDDWLAHENVLKEVNHYYQNPNVWLTYGSAINHPKFEKKDGKPLSDSVLLKNTIRDTPFQISMLRTFYASLFKQIRLKDLLYQGQFLVSADDFAFMVPMIEMAPTHTLFIPDILYVINDINPIREHHTISSLQKNLMHYLKTKEKYTPLDKTFDPRHPLIPTPKDPLDLVIFSKDNPSALKRSLETYPSSLSPLHSISVLFSASSPESASFYQALEKAFPHIAFFSEALSLSRFLNMHAFPHIAVASDEWTLENPPSLLNCVQEFQFRGALGCFMKNSKEGPIALSSEEALSFPEFRNGPFFAILQKELFFEGLHSANSDFLESLFSCDKAKDEVFLLHYCTEN